MTSSRPAAREALCRFLANGKKPAPPSGALAASFVEEAVAEGLAGLLDDLVAAALEWPQPARDALRAAHREDLARGERLLAASRRALGLLAGAGLRALPMKGAAAAGWLYADAGQRRMADADVLALDDWDESTRTLDRAGYLVADRASHAWALREPDSPLVIELHHALTSCPGLFPVDREALWKRRVAAADGSARLSSADFVVQSAIHAAFQHGFRVRLGQYLDLRRALEREPLEPVPLLAIARSYRAEVCLGLTLHAACVLVGGPSLDDTLARPLSSRLRRRLDATLDSLRRGEPLDVLELAAWRVRLCPGRRFALFSSTLAPVVPGTHESAVSRVSRGAVRALSLLRRARRLSASAGARV